MPISTSFMPKERLTFTNFPEIRQYQTSIREIMDYMLHVSAALTDFTEARYNRVDLNMDELSRILTLCRTVTQGLGTASNVCYDILLELRNVQQALYQLAYLKQQYGSSIIGTPTNAAADTEGGAF